MLDDLLRNLPPGSASTGTIGLLLLYAVWRMIKQDRSSDRQDSARDQFYKQLADLNATLLARCDRFAHERNEALARAARAEAEVLSLTGRLPRHDGQTIDLPPAGAADDLL